jgi:hypothetical protein
MMINVAGQLRATAAYEITDEDVIMKVRSLKFGALDYDFQMDAKTYNHVVAQIAKSKEINRKSIMDIILATSVKTASVDICKYVVPIVASAMKDAAQLEIRIEELVNSKLSGFLNNVKTENKVQKASIWARAAEYLFGRSDAPEAVWGF